MLRNIPSSEKADFMSIGTSGRIVIEVDTDLKMMLYAALEKENLTLKQWFIQNATTYLRDAEQPSLFAPDMMHKKRVAA
jgi:hypothetical protein